MQTKKKTAAVAVAAAVGSIAVGGAAWAWIAAQGSGSASATATATAGTVALTGTASITDLDTPSAVQIDGTATQKNRHISSVTVAINPDADLPEGCEASWFEVRQGNSGDFGPTVTVTAPFTFAVANQEYENIVPNVFVQLKNADADQGACVDDAELNELLTLTAS
ncbi:hypothetical protein [Paractinoplanes rishiriensis]|uniref:Uncharacterized protein n=1 Tax=Paractinoplanes rishiriensis TaxID=1050105 RepID=A0A919MTX0_9ACTN|nr:hypothetical protein [Actinoplanes rishiriensis]GIE99696.1 hypothetical protein Ari01nite_71610 [Actinoplanes rishiriensis]